MVVKDSQSNPNRAAEVAKELIVNDEVAMMLVASTPETTNPVSTQCEIEEVPCISTVAPWQPYFIGRQQNRRRPEVVEAVQLHLPFLLGPRGHHRGLHQHVGPAHRPTNRSAGCSPTTATATPGATSWSASRRCSTSSATSSPIPAAIRTSPTTSALRSRRSSQSEVEIITGVVIPPDFTTFWNQANQKGFKPKIASIGKALLFPVAVEALGKYGNNLSSEVWWTPTHPFKSSLTGASAADLAKGYEKASGKGWTQQIGFAHALFELAVDWLSAPPTPATRRPTSRRSASPTSIRSSARSPSAIPRCRHFHVVFITKASTGSLSKTDRPGDASRWSMVYELSALVSTTLALKVNTRRALIVILFSGLRVATGACLPVPDHEVAEA